MSSLSSLSIAFITGRREPRLDWIIDGIERQALPSDKIQLIVIDAVDDRTPEDIGFRPISAIVDLVYTPPKPTIWQGKHRVTREGWWGASGSRNTALAYCSTDFIAFVDDRAELGPSWLSAVRRCSARRESVFAGAYTKNEDGKITIDHRLTIKPEGLPNCGGGWLFGGTFALPLEWALDVNGFEEGCDGLSMEDVIFGLNLQNAGRRIDFVADMLVNQERSVAHAGSFKRTDKGVSPHDKSHVALERFGKRKRTEFTPDLTLMRADVARDGYEGFPVPDPEVIMYRDWFDDQLIAEF